MCCRSQESYRVNRAHVGGRRIHFPVQCGTVDEELDAENWKMRIFMGIKNFRISARKKLPTYFCSFVKTIGNINYRNSWHFVVLLILLLYFETVFLIPACSLKSLSTTNTDVCFSGNCNSMHFKKHMTYFLFSLLQSLQIRAYCWFKTSCYTFTNTVIFKGKQNMT